MTFDLSWALMRLRGPVESWDGRFFEAVDLQGKVGNKLLPSWSFRRGPSAVVLPLEVFDLLTGGGSHRVPGETLFPRFHEFLGPGIENAWLDPLSSAEDTNSHFSSEPFQDDAALTCRMKVLVS